MSGGFWASADANGDCLGLSSDVTKLINYFRGVGEILYCPDFEPCWITYGDLPQDEPSGWPNCDMPSLHENTRIIDTEPGK